MAASARDVARRVLARVESGSYATLALAGELGKSGLGDADRALATELVYGVLKRRTRLDRALAACAARGIGKLDTRTLDALRLAAHQILFLRVPAHAAVDDAVRSIDRHRGAKLAGFANALLRRLARDGEPALPAEDDPAVDPVDRLALVESTPRFIVERVVAARGLDGAKAVLAAWSAPAPTWLRVNRRRAARDAVAQRLREERPRIEMQPLSSTGIAPDALAASRGGDLFTTRAFAEGLFTAQDLGAQLVVRLVEPRAGERLLDACSGVGGKSTYLAELTDDGARIDAADLSPRKRELAEDAARRLGLTSISPTTVDLTDEQASLAADYDRVLLDAPCSGLGVLRRHPEAKWRDDARAMSDKIRALATLQARLLDALVPRVRPGGLLVYSVCTFTDEEGPAQIASLLARHPSLAVDPPDDPSLASRLSPDGALRTWSDEDADAFYAVRLRKRST